MKVVGGNKTRSVWERFNRVQRRAERLGIMEGWERGTVYRFMTHDEYDDWKWQQRLKIRESRMIGIS